MARAPRGSGLRAVRQKPVTNRKLEGTEAEDFSVLTAHECYLIRIGTLRLVHFIESPVRVANWPGLWPKACLNNLQRCA